MEFFDAAFDATELIERGYVNNPADPGGPTNHGITTATARAAGYTGDMRELPIETAKAIAKQYFWLPIQGDAIAQISPAIAAKVFDLNFQFYAGAAVTFLQRSLRALGAGELVPDGHIGPITLTALRTFIAKRKPDGGEQILLRSLTGLQIADYVRQVERNPAKAGVYFGWLRKRVQ